MTHFRANEELDTIEAKKDQELTRAKAENRLLKTKISYNRRVSIIREIDAFRLIH